MSEAAHGELLDLIYGAAVEPALWIPAMERFADLIGGESAWLSQLNLLDGGGGGLTARMHPQMPELYNAHFAQCNLLSNVADPDRYRKTWTPRILTDEDWVPKAELLRSEYYNDFMLPMDVHSVLMIRLAVDAHDIAALNINRSKRRGQFGRAAIRRTEQLHPHLIRAFRLTRKLAESGALNDDMAEFLDRSAHGLFLVDHEARVQHANQAGEALLAEGDGLAVVCGKLSAPGRDVTRRMQGLIATATAPGRMANPGGALSIATAGRRSPLSVTITPARSERFSVFRRRALALVCVTDLDRGVGLPEQTLRDMFGLSAAEARVALALCNGLSARDLAETLGIKMTTLRSHLGNVFEKTGARRQSDVVALVMRSAGLRFN